MSMLQVNPGQEKTVAMLGVALVAAIAVTVLRVHPAASSKIQAAKVAQQSGALSVSITPGKSRSRPTRNPFVSPILAQAAAVPSEVHPLRTKEGFGVRPINPLPSLEIKPIEDTPSKVADDKDDAASRPAFTLLATIKGGNGLAAIIRVGDSTVKVVEVGDALGSGFTVKSLRPGRAVLTDGRVTIIANQTHS